MSEWMPIETAPKNGNAIILWGDVEVSPGMHNKYPPEFNVGYWHNGGWQHRWLDAWVVGATHWMPLPDVPK